LKNDAIIVLSEGDAVEVDDPSTAWFGYARGFARSHGNKELENGNLGYHREGSVSESCLSSARELVHGSEELRCDRFLVLSWWVDIGECG
jgi:hypothetical protein